MVKICSMSSAKRTQSTMERLLVTCTRYAAAMVPICCDERKRSKPAIESALMKWFSCIVPERRRSKSCMLFTVRLPSLQKCR